MSQTALYRHFDASGTLLYVGVSFSAVVRFRAHLSYSEWTDRIARMEVEYYATRHEAEMAEWVAIGTENPVHNIRRSASPPGYKPDTYRKEKPQTVFRAFLDATGRTQIGVAKELGLTKSYMSQLVAGLRKPSLEMAFQIERLTDGAVPAISWVDAAAFDQKQAKVF